MNPSRARSKRVPPARTGPIRNPMTGQGKADGPQAGGSVTSDETFRPVPVTSSAVREALECGVQTAYAVIDDYMRRGYEAARRNQENPNGRGHMSEDKSSYNSWSNPWGPMSPLMEQWSMAMRTWTDAWSAMVPGARMGAWPSATWGQGGSYSAAPPPAVSVEVSSLRPVEVTAHFKPGADLTGKLVADSFAPPLQKGVSISHQGGRLRVSVSIAMDQAAGRYNGVIRAADGCIAGDLTVVIEERTAEPA
jgi:hypothetical protein